MLAQSDRLQIHSNLVSKLDFNLKYEQQHKDSLPNQIVAQMCK